MEVRQLAEGTEVFILELLPHVIRAVVMELALVWAGWRLAVTIFSLFQIHLLGLKFKSYIFQNLKIDLALQ